MGPRGCAVAHGALGVVEEALGATGGAGAGAEREAGLGGVMWAGVAEGAVGASSRRAVAAARVTLSAQPPSTSWPLRSARSRGVLLVSVKGRDGSGPRRRGEPRHLQADRSGAAPVAWRTRH